VPFEVASVKPHKSAERVFGFRISTGWEIYQHGRPRKSSSAVAYNLPSRARSFPAGRIGFVPWENAYDIEAKATRTIEKPVPEDRAASAADASCAAGRAIQVDHRRDTKEQPVTSSPWAKNDQGSKSRRLKRRLRDPKNHCHFAVPPGSRNSCESIQHGRAGRFGFELYGSAADRPHCLTGLYDIDTDGWVPMLKDPVRPDGPSAEDIAITILAPDSQYDLRKLG